MNKRTEINHSGIELAAHYLENNGAEIIEREWKCDSGIADLIVKEKTEIAFVQVKTCKASENGLPEDAVTASVRSKFEQLAIKYLASHSLPSCRIRFDIISINLIENSRTFLRHHRDAAASGA
jgi:putative endonuclease